MSKSAMKKSAVRFNYNDYMLLPEDKRYEILNGDLCMVPAPSVKHQKVCLNLGAALLRYVREKNLGQILIAPCDVILSDENILQPDILFVCEDHCGIVGKMNVQGAPDLAVEVLSPGTRNKDLEVKRKIYDSFGVEEYWIVDTEAFCVEIFVWSEQGYLLERVCRGADRLSSPLMPDFGFPLSELFQD